MTETQPDGGIVWNIVGERVALGPLRKELVPLYQQWHNSFWNQRGYGVPRPVTAEQADAWYDRRTADERSATFTIYERASRRPIGRGGLYDINHRSRCSMFDLMIGAEDAQGAGYGTEATRLIVDYAFTALGLRSLMLEVLPFNLGAIRAYEKAGFRECGRRRQCWLMGGVYYDELLMDIIADEFVSPVLARVFAPDVPK